MKIMASWPLSVPRPNHEHATGHALGIEPPRRRMGQPERAAQITRSAKNRARAAVLCCRIGDWVGAGNGRQLPLSKSDGAQVTERSFRGNWESIYFGYASCPEICSTVIQQVAAALADLGPAAANPQRLFITLDPAHNKPEQLSRYLSNFDRRIVGLTGTETQTQAAVQSFHLYFKQRMLDNGASSIDHSSFLFLMKPDGSFARL